MILAAVLALAWAAARAQLQSVTVDEADSYLLYVAPGWAAVFRPGSANHLLNTLLTRIVTTALGLSHLTLRAPALLGAGLYVAFSLGICAIVSPRPSIRWPLFVCLAFNPFVMDYLVAARGYGLALGFLMAAIWGLARSRYGVASACAGLSFCANFSFAYVAAGVIVIASVRAWRETKGWRAPSSALVAGIGLPLTLCGWTLSRWPPGELSYGGTRLAETWTSIASATFDEWNPALLTPSLGPLVEALRSALPLLFAAIAAWQTGRVVRSRQPLGLALAATGLIALVGHWLQFRLAAIPLPLERTGIFFVPLAILLVGLGAALPATSRPAQVARRAAVAALGLSALYFVGCLRLSYFREWRFGAEGKAAFVALSRSPGPRPLRDVGADWRYSDALNFYRVCLRHPEIGPVSRGAPMAPGRSAYVLYLPEAREFIRKQGLRVIYRGPRTDVVVAIPAPVHPE
jgi:hypothetical protein